MTVLDNPALPKGSLVLVTGVTGFVGSGVADQFLHYGYKVRGTIRDAAKGVWLQEAFDAKYGTGNFELVSVPDMVADGAYDEVVKGVDAIAHVASIMSFDADPNKVIPPSIAGALNALKSAYAEPSVKRFVLTSSSTAAIIPVKGQGRVVITHDSWNEKAIKEAWADPPYDAARGLWTYGASKTQAEQEVWKYHKENRHKRPDLVVNTVLPNLVYGAPIDVKHQGYPSSAALISTLYQGQTTPVHISLAPQYYIGAKDQGRLHVLGVIHPDVKDERIFGFAGKFAFDDVLQIFRDHEPEKKFIDNFHGGVDPTEIVPAKRAEQLLRDLGQPGWASLEESVLEIVESLKAGDAV